jgi:hypothetical protein
MASRNPSGGTFPRDSEEESAMYVDGSVMAIPKAKLDAYKKMARKAGRIWKEDGALDYVE